ncbi:MAG: hypothetical protein WCP12_16730 [bacterium]
MSRLLASGCVVQANVSQHDYARQNLLTHQSTFALTRATTKGDVLGSTWQVSAQASPVKDQPEATDLSVTFACKAGVLKQGRVSVDLTFSAWSADHYVLMPAAAYNGNRFLSRKIPYSPKLYFVQDIGPDKPIIITDVPRLAIGEGVSRIQERSGSLATPAIGFHDATRKLGFLLLTTQGNTLGDYGINIEESRDRSHATISLTSPVVRELYNYRICDNAFPSLDQPHDFKAGDEVTICFRVLTFEAPRVQSLFDTFARVRKDTPCTGTPMRKRKPRPLFAVSYSACLRLQLAKFNRDNFVQKHGYYSVGPRTNFLQDWQIGWTGGMISTYPLLFANHARTRQNVLRNFDWLFPNGISPSGFFWDCGRNGTEWLGGDIRKPHTANWHLIRKSGDAVFFIVKQFLLMEQLGIVVKPGWGKGLQGVCDAFVRLWENNHQFGQFVHAQTSEICVGGSTSGAIVPAALVLASRYFDEPAYLVVAQAAAETFYREFTVKGLSCGGPGDACQNPDSESWYALIESYVALYEATGSKIWLTRAAETSRQFSTWVVAYDFKFPPRSTFAKEGIRTTGAVYANTQNKHAAPGLCTFSGLGLLKLFRATNDRFHLDLLQDIAHNLPQYLPHPLKPLGDATPGHMCERVNMTDWEGPERIGETLHMSTWAETSLMLTAIEIPGLYVQPDQSLVVAFDNIEATIVADTPHELTLRLTNPTPAPARVTILSERHADAVKLFAENSLFGCRTLNLNSNETKVVSFEK